MCGILGYIGTRQAFTMYSPMRLVHVDILKGLAIIGIVLQHCNFHIVTENLNVAVFFMVSGYFFKEEGMGMISEKRASQLIIPYLWFVLLFFLTKWLFYYLEEQILLESLRRAIKEIHLFKQCIILHKSIWFLPVLFVMTILYRGVRYVKNERVVLGIVLFSYLLGSLLDNYWHLRVIYLSGSVLSGMIYFHFGYMLKIHERELDRVNSGLLLIILVIWCSLTLTLEPDHSYKDNIHPIYLPLMVIPSIIALFILLKRRGNHKIAKPFVLAGVYSLGVLGYHSLCNIVMDETEVDKMVGMNAIPYMRFITLLLLVPVLIYITNRFIPFTIGKRM